MTAAAPLRSATGATYIDPDKAIDDTVAWMRANTHELD